MEEEFIIKTAKVGDTEIEYCAFGAGETPFVLLPGMSLSYVCEYAAAVAVAYTKVAKKYRVYLFDIPKDLSACASIESISEDTAKVLNALGISNAYFCGASLGSIISQYIAAEHPELVKKLVLASTISRPNPDSTAVISRWLELAKSGDVIGLNRQSAKEIYSSEYYEKHSRVFKATESIGTPEQLKRFSTLAQASLNVNNYKRLGKIECPTLVIGSMQDKVVFPQGTLDVADALKSELHMYEGYSHACYDEAPDFLDRVLDFLAK